jgi:surface protein
MIYLKNIREKQTIHIPRTEINSKVVVIKSYDEGYADGIVEGKKLQKLKLTNLAVSENGVYKREDGWNEVKVDVPDIPSKTQQKTLYVTKNTDVVLPDEGYDGLSQVNINATQYGQDKRNEGYEDGYNAGNKKGYADGKTEGIAIQKSKLTNLSVTTNGTYERTDGWNKIDVNVPSQTPKLQQKNITLTKDIETVTPSTGYDGLTKVGIDATFYVKTKRDEGYAEGKTDGIKEGYNQGYADGKEEGGDVILTTLTDKPMWEDRNPINEVIYNPSDYNADGFSSVIIDISTVYSEGHYQGKTEGYENGKADGIEEGYANGYSDGKAEGGEINLVELEETPKHGDGENNIIEYKPSNYNADGFSNVKINVTSVYHSGYMEGNTEGYNQGYNAGYEEGKSDVEDVELIELSHVPKMEDVNLRNELIYTPSRYNADGFSKATINITNIYGTGYNEGYDDGKKEVFKINLKNEGVKLTNCKFREVPNWADFSGIKDMSEMFKDCVNLTVIPSIDTSNVTNMVMAFENCLSLTTIPQLDTSKVTNMLYTFHNCPSLTTIPELDTSNVTEMSGLVKECKNLISIPKLNASNVTTIDFFFGDFSFDKLTDFGGLTDLKPSMNDRFGFVKAPNLTYQSCINILNGLYDFVGNGETPSSSQGKLRVHQNFLDKVGSKISIATNKGWTITA